MASCSVFALNTRRMPSSSPMRDSSRTTVIEAACPIRHLIAAANISQQRPTDEVDMQFHFQSVNLVIQCTPIIVDQGDEERCLDLRHHSTPSRGMNTRTRP